jgi:hypothetical protein
MLGSSPGTNFELSLAAVLKWPRAPDVPETHGQLGYGTLYDQATRRYPKAQVGSPAFTVTSGVEFFIGPRLGLQFGH